jgi:hypothetical protein
MSAVSSDLVFVIDSDDFRTEAPRTWHRTMDGPSNTRELQGTTKGPAPGTHTRDSHSQDIQIPDMHISERSEPHTRMKTIRCSARPISSEDLGEPLPAAPPDHDALSASVFGP